MNLKQFYNEQKKIDNDHFFQETGMKRRSEIQKYSDGSDCEEVFNFKIPFKREYIGVEFHGCIFYILPINPEEILLLIYDDSLMPIIDTVSDLSGPRFDVYCRYTHSLFEAINNAREGNFSKVGVILDADMLCFAKQIYYPVADKIKNGYLVEPQLIAEAISIVEFRNLCEKEITSFSGFSPKEQREIALKETLSVVRHGLKLIRLEECFNIND